MDSCKICSIYAALAPEEPAISYEGDFWVFPTLICSLPSFSLFPEFHLSSDAWRLTWQRRGEWERDRAEREREEEKGQWLILQFNYLPAL